MSDRMIRFDCPICRARMVTLLANAEQIVSCPQCDAGLSVPFLPLQASEDTVLIAEEAPIEFRRPVSDSESDLDMTPMVDVTFLLLIFFMVTAAFAMQKSFQLPPPNENAPSTQVVESDEAVITVRIDELNTFHVSTSFWDEELEAPSEQDLLRRLRDAKLGDGRGNVPNTLIVEAHGSATHEKVIIAMDAGTDTGMKEVKLRTIDD